MMKEKLSLPKQIREYNKKTTPVHHIHIKPNVSVCSTLLVLVRRSIIIITYIRIRVHGDSPLVLQSAKEGI